MRLQMSSPFLPFVPAVAEGDRGRVVFPGTTRAGRGLLSLSDRLPGSPGNVRHAAGPSTYTGQPAAHSIRVGGLWAPAVIGRPDQSTRTRSRVRDLDNR